MTCPSGQVRTAHGGEHLRKRDCAGSLSSRRRFDPATPAGRRAQRAQPAAGWSHGGGKYDQPARRPRIRLAHGLLAVPAGRGGGPAAGVAAAAGRGSCWTSPGPQASAAAQAAASGYAVVQVLPQLRGGPGAGRAAGRPGGARTRHPVPRPCTGPRPRPARLRGGGPGQPGLPGGRVGGWGDRRRRGAVPAPDGRGHRRRDRPGAAARRPAAGLRGLPGPGHVHPGRAAPLGRAHRPAAGRGGAGALAGRPDHPVLRPGAARRPARPRRGWRSAGSGRAPCCPRPWWITCCARTRAPSCGWSGPSWPRARRTRGRPGPAPGAARTNRSVSTCWPRPASPPRPVARPSIPRPAGPAASQAVG